MMVVDRVELEMECQQIGEGAVRHSGTEGLDVAKTQLVGKADGHWRLSLGATDWPGLADRSAPHATAQVTAGMVLNLGGAWVDEIAGKSGTTVEPRCSGIKGVHIALRLPPEFCDWGLFTYNSIGEPLYCLPLNDIHYIGLTRTPFDGDIADVSASNEEIDWLIAEANRCLPGLAISRQDILFSWAGVNPLTRDQDEPLGSREIKIHDLSGDGLPGMLALTGGPIMTHRRVAKRLLSAVSARLSPSGSPQDLKLRVPDRSPEENAVRLESETFNVSTAAVKRCARDEQPRNLADLLIRRLGAGWASDQGLALARPVAEAAAAELGWSEARIEAELRTYEQHLKSARRRPSG